MNRAETAWVVDRTTLLALVPPYAVYWPAASRARSGTTGNTGPSPQRCSCPGHSSWWGRRRCKRPCSTSATAGSLLVGRVDTRCTPVARPARTGTSLWPPFDRGIRAVLRVRGGGRPALYLVDQVSPVTTRAVAVSERRSHVLRRWNNDAHELRSARPQFRAFTVCGYLCVRVLSISEANGPVLCLWPRALAFCRHAERL
jgi:hypothetical protein